MLDDLQLKNRAARIAAKFPGCSPSEVAETIVDDMLARGEDLPVDIVTRAEHHATVALSQAAARRRMSFPDPAWATGDLTGARLQPLGLVDPAQWAGQPIPERQWLLRDWMPLATTTLFTGAGGVGKSLMGQQLATAVGLGRTFMGIETTQTPAIYMTCEDKVDELHRRQAAICDAMGAPLETLGGRLHLLSLVDEPDNMLATFAADNTMSVGPLMARLRLAIERTGAGFIVLDNVAHLFGGNEIVKAHVAAFVGMLNALSAKTGATILLVAHPNKAGDAYSGNVAWENQVRSRIFLDRPRDQSGHVIDADARVLSRDKSNYAAAGATVAFRWHRWAFVSDDDLPAEQRAEVATNLLAGIEDRAFLKCLDLATERRINVGHVPSGNHAPKVFAAMVEGKGTPKVAFERAMQRLVSAGVIEFDAELWSGPNRHPKRGIRRVIAAPTPLDAICLSH